MAQVTRRDAIGILASAAAVEQQAAAQPSGSAVSLGWLDGTPPEIASGVSWGVPWARGTVRREQSFSLTGADGAVLPLQSWTLAYWPDGSVKWTGFATVAGPCAGNSLRLAPGAATVPATP